jgi:inorganic pyrophosphatase/exopolyphosphatase
MHIVLGNEAADLDSIACSLVMAWRLSHDSACLVLPVVNTTRADLVLRTEVEYMMKRLAISSEDICFVDELDESCIQRSVSTRTDERALAPVAISESGYYPFTLRSQGRLVCYLMGLLSASP